MKTLRAILAATLMALVGCASTTPSTAGSQRGPGVLAVRNSTGGTLKSVRIGEERASAGSSRLGKLSPVLPDVTYPFVRSTKAAPLPPRVRLGWVDASNHERSAVVELGDLLKQSSGAEGEALLFEIGPAGTVDARLVTVPK